jgi:hypothetical protein
MPNDHYWETEKVLCCSADASFCQGHRKKREGQRMRNYRYPTSTLSHRIHLLEKPNGIKKSLGR